MKTGQDLNRGVSQQSLAESYQVPALDGRMVQAIPLKFCLNYRPPTIAVVYTFQHSNSKKKTGKIRKYIHEVKVDFKSCPTTTVNGKDLPTLKEIEKLTSQLCEQEPTYLNINIIAQAQVLKLINKLYEKIYGCQPPTTPRQLDSKAPEAAGKGEKESDEDDYESDFDLDVKEDKSKPKAEEKREKKDESEEDDWDMEDDYGEKKEDSKVQESKKDASKEDAEKKRRDIFFGGDDNDLDVIEDLDMLGGKDFDNKNEDKFNQVLSTSKENGGLLASIGLKKGDGHDESIGDESQEEDPHKKSDLFDTSKDRGKANNEKKAQESDQDEFDLGFGSGKKADAKEADVDVAGMSEDGDGEEISEEQKKIINEEFAKIYEKDPELRKALEKSDPSTFSEYEKYQIIEAYTHGGGATALQIEVADDDEDLALMDEMTEDDKKQIESQFDKLYASDPILQEELGPLQNLNLQQKYHILVQYHKAGDSSGMVGTSQGGFFSEGETEIIEIDGKKFRRVQIEEGEEEYLMDEEQNIYDQSGKCIGQAGDV